MNSPPEEGEQLMEKLLDKLPTYDIEYDQMHTYFSAEVDWFIYRVTFLFNLVPPLHFWSPNVPKDSFHIN